MSKPLQYGNVPSLASLLDLHKNNTMAQINCHQVGEIVSFNPSTQTAEVQIKMTYIRNGEIKNYPLILDCPCIVLCGGKGRITFPIEKGDSCLVLFNDRDIDNWYSGGQTMPPRTNRTHAFADAFAIVGPHNKQNQFSDYFNSGTEIKYGNSTIQLEDNKVKITNGTATVEMSSSSISIVGNVAITGNFTVNGKDVSDTHKHSGVVPGGGNTGGVV